MTDKMTDEELIKLFKNIKKIEATNKRLVNENARLKRRIATLEYSRKVLKGSNKDLRKNATKYKATIKELTNG